MVDTLYTFSRSIFKILLSHTSLVTATGCRGIPIKKENQPAAGAICDGAVYSASSAV